MNRTGLFGLFVKGLRWSYRKYGVKGGVAFLAAGLLVYYLVDRELSNVGEEW